MVSASAAFQPQFITREKHLIIVGKRFFLDIFQRVASPFRSPGTWEALRISLRNESGGGDRTTNPWTAVGRSGPLGAKRQTHRRVSPSEGNGARREGPSASHILIVPVKQGNSLRRTLGREGGCGLRSPLGETS